MTTGTSVLGLKYDGGVLLAADTLGKLNFRKRYNITRFRTNAGKKTISALAVDCWRQLPMEMKNLSFFSFPKKVKQYLLSKQN